MEGKFLDKGTYPSSSCLDVAKVSHVFCPTLEIGAQFLVKAREGVSSRFLVRARELNILVTAQEQNPWDVLQLHHRQAPLGK